MSVVFSKVETLSVGTIDKQYASVLSKENLVKIIKEIETLFETQLGFDVINYKEKGGKPIDIVYLPPSQKKKRILQSQKRSELVKEKIDTLEASLSYQNTLLNSTKNELERGYDTLNRKIHQLNSYISRKNRSRNLSKYDYDSIKRYISKEQTEIGMQKRELEREKRSFNSKRRSLKNRVMKYNLLISQHNYYQRDIERLSKGYKEIKGKTKKYLQTVTTAKTEDTKTMTTDKHSMNDKIEIYDFENLNLLKVILAHEIGHLVGVKHIDADGALMHPYLQKEQIDNLSLSIDDINAFYEAFH